MPHSETQRILVRSKEFLVENYREPLTLGEFAREVGYSPYHLQRRFADTFGESPLEFVTRLRMAEAKRLLGRSGMNVADVCLEVGYQSQATFTKSFARRFGVTPTAYRRVFTIPGLDVLRAMPACFRFTWK